MFRRMEILVHKTLPDTVRYWLFIHLLHGNKNKALFPTLPKNKLDLSFLDSSKSLGASHTVYGFELSSQFKTNWGFQHPFPSVRVINIAWRGSVLSMTVSEGGPYGIVVVRYSCFLFFWFLTYIVFTRC